MKHKVWTVVITLQDGMNVHVAPSEAAAKENVAAFVRTWWWTDLLEELGVSAEAYEQQHGTEEMIKAYFEAESAQFQNESYAIDQHEIDL